MTPEERAVNEAADQLRGDRRIRELMRWRCYSQGCDYENCMDRMLRVYARCRWCGRREGSK